MVSLEGLGVENVPLVFLGGSAASASSLHLQTPSGISEVTRKPEERAGSHPTFPFLPTRRWQDREEGPALLTPDPLTVADGNDGQSEGEAARSHVSL